MPIGDDWTIDTTAKTIRHTSGTTVYTTQELFTWVQDEIDEPSMMKYKNPMTLETPNSATMRNGWYLGQGQDGTDFLDDGAITSDSSWTRVTGTLAGIVQVQYTGTDPVTGDIGLAITHTDGDSGLVVGFNATEKVIYVRPDSSAAGDDFDMTTGSYSVNSGSITVDGSNSPQTGEIGFANLFTLGTLASYTRLYIYQNGVKLTDWWANGAIDILVKVREFSTLIDDAEVTVFGRRPGSLFTFGTIDLSAITRSPLSLSSGEDGNDDEGARQLITASNTGTYVVGDFIQGGTSGAIGRITGGSNLDQAAATLKYHLCGDLTEFTNTETITTISGSGTGDGTVNGAPTASSTGPENTSGVTYSFTHILRDINNGNGDQAYAIEIDPNSNTLRKVFQRNKYDVQQGSATSMDGINGEAFIGIDTVLEYDTWTVDLVEGLVGTGGTSTASGTILSYYEVVANTSGYVSLRNTRGTFVDNEDFTDSGTGDVDLIASGAVTSITPVQANPFGAFAGTLYQGAVGVYFIVGNLDAGDVQNYSLQPITGGTQTPPNVVSVTVTGLFAGDQVVVFVLSGGLIDEAQWTSHAANNTLGGTTFEISDGPFDAQTPPTGTIHAVDVGTLADYRYRYSSWSGSIATLASRTGLTADAVTSATVLEDSAGDFLGAGNNRVHKGDVVRNTTEATVVTIVDIEAATAELFFNAVQPSNTNTVVIDGKTYTFQTTLTDVDGNVHIGSTLDESIQNLCDAIRNDAASDEGEGSGTGYAASMTTHATYTAQTDLAGDIAQIYAKDETLTGDSVSETLADGGSQWQDVAAVSTSTTSSQRITTTAGVTDWSGDSYEINVLAQAYDGSDTAYVTLIDARVPWGSSTVQLTNSLTYSTSIPVKVVVRQATQTSAIQPYELDTSVGANGLTTPAIRNAEGNVVSANLPDY